MNLTVTGADERTRLEDLWALCERVPFVEIGLLYSETPEGRNRYPSREWLAAATLQLGERCAVHVCGTGARPYALAGPSWIARAGRVQFNGWYAPSELKEALRRCPVVIVQHDLDTRPDYRSYPLEGLSLLVDGSRGRGVKPRHWERPDTDKAVGFAGGLSPENLKTELPRIAAVARDPWWVDMESSLRDEEDWFSVERAWQAAKVVATWRETEQER